MNKFYLTFGQNHPLRNGYVLVEAPSEEEARQEVVSVFGTKWAFLYSEDKMNFKYFLEGQQGKTLFAGYVD